MAAEQVTLDELLGKLAREQRKESTAPLCPFTDRCLCCGKAPEALCGCDSPMRLCCQRCAGCCRCEAQP